MKLTDFVHTVGVQWKYRYHESIGKLTLTGGFTCPNRDGTISRGGCTFCSVSSFSDLSDQDIPTQISSGVNLGAHRLYFAYFQAYTSTYAETQVLERLYREALSHSQIVGLCVGTRPDCLSRSCLDLLCRLRDSGIAVIVELGLQSAHDRTLRLINRGHDFASYEQSASLVRSCGLELCTHLIIGLPGESLEDNLNSLDAVLQVGTDALKLHPLHIVRGSVMERQYRSGRIAPLTLQEYTCRAGELIAHTPSRIVFHRVSATARAPFLVTPDYCQKKFPVIDAVTNYLNLYGVQGSAIGDPYLGEIYYQAVS